MATPRFAWGIDIGNRALKAVRLSPGPEGLRIDDYDVIEHEQILSHAGDNRETLITSALNSFVQRHEVKGSAVAVGVSGQSSFARFIKLPPVETKKIPEIVKFEAIQQIPFPLEEVEWSYQLFQDPQSPDVEVGIFAMRKDLVSQHIRYFTDAGLNVQVVQMNPLAVYNGMYHDERVTGTTMIVDLGAENTDLIIAEGEQIWLRSIPIGGNNFTEALTKAFKLKFPKAEELKRNAATSKYGRQILQAMKPVFNDLVGEIQRSIGFYASVHRESRIGRVLALGGTFRLPGLQKYLQQNLQIDVHRIERLGVGTPVDARVATLMSENILSSAGAYGLAIQALGQSKINSSLLPAAIRREKMWLEKTKWFAAAAACFVAAPLIGYAAIQVGRQGLNSTYAVEAQNVSTQGQAEADSTNWESQVENAGAPDRQRIANMLSLTQGRATQPQLIQDIIASLPKPDPVLLDPAKIKTVPRAERNMVRIDRITMEYKDDMAPILALSAEAFKQLTVQGAPAPEVGTGAGGGASVGRGRGAYLRGRGIPMPQVVQPQSTDSSTPTVPKQRGFVIEVQVTTPRADGASFVLEKFVDPLRKLNQNAARPPVGYSIERVEEPLYVKLSNTEQATAAATGRTNFNLGASSYQGRAVFGRGGYGRGRGAYNPGFPSTPNGGIPATSPTDQPPEFNPMEDPATKEDMSNDTQVTVRMAVILDPPPKQPPAGTVAQANP